MKHCRWWSQCKTLYEYKCFEPAWPSWDCVCVRFFFSAWRVCERSSAAAALHLFAPAASTPVHGVKRTHKSDIEMCRRPFWADGESCLSRCRENEPTSHQRRPPLHLILLPPPPTVGLPLTAQLSSAKVTVQQNSPSQQAAGEAWRWRKERRWRREEGSWATLWSIFLQRDGTELRIFRCMCEKEKWVHVYDRDTGWESPPTEGETSWPYTLLSLISSVFKKHWTLAYNYLSSSSVCVLGLL